MVPVADLTCQRKSPGQEPGLCFASMDSLVRIDNGCQVDLPSADLRLQFRRNPSIQKLAVERHL